MEVPKLGVGLNYQVQLGPFMEEHPDSFDYLEVVPDILWTDLGPGSQPRYVEDPEGTAFLDRVSASKPVIPHSIGLSIGSAHLLDREHIAQMARWYEWLGFPWHSDHLAYHLAEDEEEQINMNITMALPLDRETLHMVAARVREVRGEIPVPFLVENNVYYFVVQEQDYDEAGFLTALCEESGCNLLLDLHNLYANCRNLGTDPYDYLGRLELERVAEIHVAGGMEFEGMYIDAHSGASPEPVWELLDWVLPRCTNLGGVTFELFGSWFDVVGEDGVLRQLERMRDHWDRHQPAPGIS
jgi:uncharacterized protein (UPF0276 family)